MELGQPTWRTLTWREVEVGDVVRIRNRDTFPADLLDAFKTPALPKKLKRLVTPPADDVSPARPAELQPNGLYDARET